MHAKRTQERGGERLSGAARAVASTTPGRDGGRYGQSGMGHERALPHVFTYVVVLCNEIYDEFSKPLSSWHGGTHRANPLRCARRLRRDAGLHATGRAAGRAVCACACRMYGHGTAGMAACVSSQLGMSGSGRPTAPSTALLVCFHIDPSYRSKHFRAYISQFNLRPRV